MCIRDRSRDARAHPASQPLGAQIIAAGRRLSSTLQPACDAGRRLGTQLSIAGYRPDRAFPYRRSTAFIAGGPVLVAICPAPVKTFGKWSWKAWEILDSATSPASVRASKPRSLSPPHPGRDKATRACRSGADKPTGSRGWRRRHEPARRCIDGCT